MIAPSLDSGCGRTHPKTPDANSHRGFFFVFWMKAMRCLRQLFFRRDHVLGTNEPVEFFRRQNARFNSGFF